MENTPQGSAPSSLPADSDARLLAMCAAVAAGLTVRVAILRFYGSKQKYYSEVSMTDKLFIRRLSKLNVDKARRGEQDGSLTATTVFLERGRHQALLKRTEQVSVLKGRLVSINEYINALIYADLRTIDSNS